MRRTRSNFPKDSRGHGPRVPARLGDRAAPIGYQTVTARSPDGDTRIASVAPMDAAQLDTIPLFAGLTLDQRESVASACDELEVEEGTVARARR